MKNRVRLFICVFGLLGISLWSTSVFAQASLSVSSVPRTTAIVSGHTEIVGDLLVAHTGVGGLGAGTATLTVDYGVPITVPTTQNNTSWNIQICGTNTLAGLGAACGTGFLYTVGTAPGQFTIGGANQNQLLITLPPVPGTAGAATLTVSNVKVSLNGFAGTKLTASLGVSAAAGFGAYSIGSGQNTTDVITSVAAAIGTPAATGGTTPPRTGTGRGQLLSTGTVSDRFFTIDVPENFVDAFKATVGSSGYLNDPALTYTFSNIPPGVNLNLVGGGAPTLTNSQCSTSTAAPPDIWKNLDGSVVQTLGTGNLTNTTVNQSTATTVLNFTGATFDLNLLETVRLSGCINTSGLTIPLANGSITVTITLSPNGAALQTGSTPQITPVGGNFPRYQSASTAALAIVDIISAETDLLIPFATRAVGFDTGIAISNTTSDPFGAFGASPNDGTIKLDFYPTGAGGTFSYQTTTGSPGVGLGSGGVLATGKTWTVLLSELLGAISGAPTSFTGYIFVTTRFTNAHGAAFTTDFKGFTSESPMLVMPQVQLNPRQASEQLNR